MIARIEKLEKNGEFTTIFEKEVKSKQEMQDIKKFKEILEEETKNDKYIATIKYNAYDGDDEEYFIK